MNGAEVIVESILRRGLRRIFLYGGGTIAPVLDAATRRGLDLMVARHEQGAGYAALAAARLTGDAQVVMVTSGPGVTNVVTPVADAYYDSTPLVVLTGQVGTGDMRGTLPIRQRGFQEVDTVGLLRPVTKAQFLALSPDDLAGIMEEAFSVAQEGRPGPVVVDLPMNVQRGEVTSVASKPATAGVKNRDQNSGKPDPEAIARVVQWLGQAERPLILAGQGVLLARAQEELRLLAEKGQIPVSQSLPGLGSFPSTSPLALGFHGHTGNQYANRAIHEADLLLVVGSRLDVRQTGSRVESFVPNGRVVRMDIDPAELEHSRVRTDWSIRADAKAGLTALLRALEGQSLPDWSAWREQIEAWRREFALTYDRTGALKPQYVIEVANTLTADRPVTVVSGVGSHQQWVARHFDFDFPRRSWLTSAGHGAMGFDLPSAVGAQLTHPDQLVLCFVGDGSLQLNIQEMATIVERRLPVKIVVLDNHRFGIVSQFQKLNWASDPSSGGKWNPDFAAVARAYGIFSVTARDWNEVESALKEALAVPGPALVHCLVDEEEDVVPMLLAGQTMDKMWPYE